VRPTAPVLRTFHHAQFDASRLAELKGAQTVSVCLPARDEAATVGSIVACIKRELVDHVGLVDEILVVDDHSEDRTSEVAAAAGARVVRAADVLAEFGAGHGKGEAMWKSLYEAEGDLIVWCDADVLGFGAHYVTGLLGPLLTNSEIGFVKGFYDRPGELAGERGGRVTELAARPILSLLFPHLSSIVQPLAGEYAGQREVLEQLPFVEGYGVDIALLIDVAATFGTDAVAQVDLGTRVHRNRPLHELAPQAVAVLEAALDRAGGKLDIEAAARPPLMLVPGYQRRSA
jgi:glucosyl-3-phosphoglycerate synthase